MVLIARHRELGRRVALKLTLADPLQGPDERGAKRFEREARAVAALKHPGIVGIHEFGEEDGRRYLAMELLPGGSLQDALDRDGPLAPREAARLTEQLARALQFAHERGVVHRDLKPANVLLDEEGRPRITDFGIAKDLSNLSEQLTKTGAAVGTPSYAPPEQLRGDKEALGPRSDVYSLGATLYALLTGRPPFVGANPINVIAAAMLREAEPPSTHRAEVERDLDTICAACLEKAPADRYPSAEALAEDLARYVAGEPILARPPDLRARLRKWRRRHPLLAPAAVVAPLLALVLGVGLVLTRVTTAGAGDHHEGVPLTLTYPPDGFRTIESTVLLEGQLADWGGWVEVWVRPGEDVPVASGAGFELPVALRPGVNEVTVRWRDAHGVEGAPLSRRIVRDFVPSWYHKLAAEDRPPLPLPEGMTFADDPRVYRWLKDESELVWVPPGAKFTLMPRTALVDSQRYPDDVPHEVTLTRGYFMGRYEVTWAQFERFARETGLDSVPSRTIDVRVRLGADLKTFEEPAEGAFVAGDRHPVFKVTWHQAEAYCNWAGLRLPTEAEWEYAARGGGGDPFPWGDGPPGAETCNCLAGDAFPYVAPVGSFARDCSPFGCFDVTGNVREWVADRFGPLTADAKVDPAGPATGTERVSRGGLWSYPPEGVAVNMRQRFAPDVVVHEVGFRVAR